jgi:acetolactate decarboxylase
LEIPDFLEAALAEQATKTGHSISEVAIKSMAESLNLRVHTVFQVSTSGSLVKGVYEGVVSVGRIKQLGTFGMGTFSDLDGEMVVLDGRVYQARADGTVREAPDSATAPFAMVMQFAPDAGGKIGSVANLEHLAAQCDTYRRSDNIFYAFRIDGRFNHVLFRIMQATAELLSKAASAQPEFEICDVHRHAGGTMVAPLFRFV